MNLNKVNIGNVEPSDNEDSGSEEDGDKKVKSSDSGYGSIFKLK